MQKLAQPSTRQLLSVVAPCFDEEAGIEQFVAELVRVLATLPELDHEIVLVDDGSRDGTLAAIDRLAAADPRVRPVVLSRNFGHEIALSAGLDFVRGDVVVLMDSDLQHPPALLPELLAKWRAGFDIVSTVRRRTAAPWLERVTSRAFYWLLNRVSEIRIEPSAPDFCLLTRRVRDQLVAMPERHRMLRGMIAWVGFARAFVPFDAPPRAAGETKYGWRQRVRLAIDGIFGFSTAPMRLAAWLGAGVAALGALYLAYVLVKGLWMGGVVAGWPSLISVVLIMGGLQLVFIGVIGAYLGRTFEQAKGRPLYVLRRDPGTGTRA